MENQKKSEHHARSKPRPVVLGASFFLLPVFFLLGFGSAWLIWGRDPSQAVAVQPQPAEAETFQRVNVSADDDPAVGPANAPITIIEFSDYQCPFCQRWHADTFDSLLKAYPDQIRFIYRDFPLYSIHPQAEPASEAANCANAQAKFWEYHELLFSDKMDLSPEAYSAYASEIGLDLGKFEECLASDQYIPEITADYKYASKLGVSSTPTFFINGIMIVGAQPLSVFQSVIDMELAGEIP